MAAPDEAAQAGPEATEAVPEPPPDVLALALEAEEALDLGDLATARDRLLSLAAAHQAAGRFAAAIDACYGALAVAPSDTNLHLALVDLYLARGWRPLAADKLVLLSHLIELDGDGPARERLCAVIASRFPDDPKLAAICA